jgi:PhnB protein
MTGTNPYFNFMGNTEEAMNYYKSVFGGEFSVFQRFSDMPGCEKMPPEEQHKIMHVSLTTPKGFVFMATDALESMGQKLNFGNNYYVAIHTESEAETDRLFGGLSMGGRVEMPPNKTFWGAYCAMSRDKFGVQWLISFTYPKTKS